MTEQEVQNELIVARATGLAAMVCLQQMIRVIVDHGVMTREQVQDATSEALAVFVTGPASNPYEQAVNDEAARTLINALGEERR